MIAFTGNFYREFRNPVCLIAALRKLSGMTLVIAGDLEDFDNEIKALGVRIAMLGKRSHGDCTSLQRKAHLLLSIGNPQDYQVPGKVYEYLGAQRPIWHITNGDGDTVPELLSSTRRGMVVENDVDAIASSMERLYTQWRAGELDQHFDLSEEAVAEYSWASQGRDLFRTIQKFDESTTRYS